MRAKILILLIISIAQPLPARASELVQSWEELNLGFRSTGESPSCLAHTEPTPPCTPVTDEEIRTSAQLPFEKKFSAITNDYRKLSNSNLDKHLQTLLRKNRGFEAYFKQAEKLVPLIEKEISFSHSTRLGSAAKILESDAIKSTDALVRDGTFPLAAKLNAMTKYQIDGQIGEQDTVFLGIRNSLDRDAMEYYFGNVTFQFNKSALLELGYFTPYPFGFSTTDWGTEISSRPCREDLRRQGPLLKIARERYRKFVFSGHEGYRRWLQLSIAHVLWEDRKLGNSPHASLNDAIEAKSRLVSRVLRAYKTMPLIPEGWSFLGNTEFDWWELKIPRKLSLKNLESVQVMLSEEDDKASMIRFERALEAFALRHHRKLEKNRQGQTVIFQLSKGARE